MSISSVHKSQLKKQNKICVSCLFQRHRTVLQSNQRNTLQISLFDQFYKFLLKTTTNKQQNANKHNLIAFRRFYSCRRKVFCHVTTARQEVQHVLPYVVVPRVLTSALLVCYAYICDRQMLRPLRSEHRKTT